MADIYTITLSDGVTTFEVYPLESNGPGNLSIPRQIQVITIGGSPAFYSFELVGDLTYRFVATQQFTVENSGGGSPAGVNDGVYTVSAGGSTYNAGTNRTLIPVDEVITTTGLPLGQIKYSIPSAEEATSILIPGRGYLNYGVAILESSVHMLENFANDTAPTNPLPGQLWYDTSNERYNKWNGSAFVNANNFPYYDLQVGTGDGGGSPLTAVEYTTGFNFTEPAGSPALPTAALQVFVNGIKQVEGAGKSYTITAPNTVTFNVGSTPAVSDDVEFYGFG